MKKINFVLGITLTLAGIVFLSVALLSETKMDGLLSGAGGACIALGVMMTYMYMHWNSPNNKERFERMMEREEIERQDELKEKIRGKSAQYTYAIGLYVISFSVVLFAVLDSFGVIEDGLIFVYYLTGILILQIIVGLLTFHSLMKKY